MSNQIIAQIYAAVVERVIAESQNDVEEYGLDQQTLQDLKESWQKRLTERKVAVFPWDPAPAPPPPPPPPPQTANPPTLPSNASEPIKSSPVATPAPLPQPIANGNYGGSRVKHESAYDGSNPGYAQYSAPRLNPQVAQQRAQALLQSQYGHQATASIAAAQSHQQTGLSLPGQQRPRLDSVGLQLPGQAGQQQHAHAQYQQQQQRSSLNSAQTDGAGDATDEWATVISEQHARPRSDRAAADRTIRRQVEEAARMLESGLMVPLGEHMKPRVKKQRVIRSNAGTSSTARSLTVTADAAPRIPQLDGTLDGEEEDSKLGLKVEDDEDAINSDLDDSEDELRDVQDDGQDASGGDYVLCTYDKVQRVKNKWKAILKDGVVQIGGKDYLFHKANGEYEW